jgi:hypothetical protein
MEIRRDEVYSRILQEMSTMDNFISRKIKVVYHRNCYRKYISKQNCSVFKTDQINFTSTEEVSTTSQTSVVTCSQYEPIKSDFCFICQNKTFKKDFKVHKSTKDGRRFILVHEIVNSLNPVFCQILPAAHALSGCDTTSSMFGIGKRTVYQVLKIKSEEFSDLVLLGEGNVEDSLAVSREFVASLYDQKAKLRADYSNLNNFRVRLATKKEASLAKLPPCEATFHQHVLRASLQTYIWKSSQKTQPPVRSPLMFRWDFCN